MAKSIKILNKPFFNIDVILGGSTYNLQFKFNTSDEAWYLTVRNSSKETLIEGIKVVGNQNLTSRFKYLNLIPNGDLWCLRLKADTSPVTRDNFGIGQTYELVWISSQSALQEQLDGVIQL